MNLHGIMDIISDATTLVGIFKIQNIIFTAVQKFPFLLFEANGSEPLQEA